MNADRARVVARSADQFFARSQEGDWDGMLAVTAPGMTAWQSGGTPRAPFADLLHGIAAMRSRMGPWTYHDVRRIVSDEGFCEQHTVRFQRDDGSVRDIAACVVAQVDADGLITRLDEYIDPSRASTWNS